MEDIGITFISNLPFSLFWKQSRQNSTTPGENPRCFRDHPWPWKIPGLTFKKMYNQTKPVYE